MTISSKFTMLTLLLAFFLQPHIEKKTVLGNNFYMLTLAFIFHCLFTYLLNTPDISYVFRSSNINGSLGQFQTFLFYFFKDFTHKKKTQKRT